MTRNTRVVWMPGGVRTEVHLGGEETDGALCVIVDQPPPGWSLPAHRHANEDETIHVLEGEFEMEIGGERMEGFFLEVGLPSERNEPDASATIASATRYGWEFVTGT